MHPSQVLLDVAGELSEFLEARVEYGVDTRGIQLQVPVHENVAKPRDRSEARAEIGGQGAELDQSVDRRPIVGGVRCSRRGDVGSDVERVLRADLESSLDEPGLVEVGDQFVDRAPRVPRQVLDRARPRANDGG